jgi:hypothetical protein
MGERSLDSFVARPPGNRDPVRFEPGAAMRSIRPETWRGRSADAQSKSCYKQNSMVFVWNGRITNVFGPQKEKARPRVDFCNLPREERSVEKEVRNFLFESAVTH